ncbi:MAG TPA: YqaA family protein [Desulfuromonadaceae bacterium]
MIHFDNQFLTHTVTNWLDQPGYGPLFGLSFLASTLLPLGSEWLLVMMLVKGYPAWATIMTATLGNSLGAVTTYLAGFYGGPLLIERIFRVSTAQQERAHNYYRRYGVFSLFFSWLPIVGDPLCLVGGLMRINFWVFTALVASGKLLRYAITAWITLQAIN